MFALLITWQDGVALVVAVEALLHSMTQNAVVISRQECIPATAPNHLEYLPIRAAEGTLQFLNNFAVTPNGTVQSLEIAVHHQHEIIESLACSNIDGTEYLGLIRLAVTDKTPDSGVILSLQSPMLQILGKAGQIDRHRYRQTHRSVGDLPEIRHGPGMRVGGQAPAFAQFTTEIPELSFTQAAFQKSARIDTGRCVRLRQH